MSDHAAHTPLPIGRAAGAVVRCVLGTAPHPPRRMHAPSGECWPS
jgi:hypothetical protein